jgi:hypothetical protein
LTGVNPAALAAALLPDDVVRLVCAALARGLSMLGDSAQWGVVMQAPGERHALPRRLPALVSREEARVRAPLLPLHLVQPTPSDDKTQHQATFRSVGWCCQRLNRAV